MQTNISPATGKVPVLFIPPIGDSSDHVIDTDKIIGYNDDGMCGTIDLPPGKWVGLGWHDELTEEQWAIVAPVIETCFLCGGDGKETCSNPDHGFISGMPGDTGRLGCPVCGHDDNHKVPNGGSCEVCNGTGQNEQDYANSESEKYHSNCVQDCEVVTTATEAGLSLMRSAGALTENPLGDKPTQEDEKYNSSNGGFSYASFMIRIFEDDTSEWNLAQSKVHPRYYVVIEQSK